MGKKGFVKGLAIGAVLAGVAALIHEMKDRELNTKEMQKAALRIKTKVAKHAKTLGKLSKGAYEKIVDTTVAEFHGVKALSAGELDDLKDELKAGWSEVQKMVAKKRSKK